MTDTSTHIVTIKAYATPKDGWTHIVRCPLLPRGIQVRSYEDALAAARSYQRKDGGPIQIVEQAPIPRTRKAKDIGLRYSR